MNRGRRERGPYPVPGPILVDEVILTQEVQQAPAHTYQHTTQIERVTRQFYARFKDERVAFLKAIQGIEEESEREHYATLMLNRLMFAYFLQKKGFLAHDPEYLSTQLRCIQQRNGHDTFYRTFLLPLFHEGLGSSKQKEHNKFGTIPYLNGGLFAVHTLEQDNIALQIGDAAFERLFSFFDEYQWHLDEHVQGYEKVITPAILGYIFEKYINQQQMGAYYTKEDVTAYIARNTILPVLIDAVGRVCPEATQQGGIWQLLRHNPERYIRDVIRGEKYLPGETEREHQERRAYYLFVRNRIEKGEICCSDDFITYNLDIEQFIQDVIHNIGTSELLHAFYQCVTQMTILDPTCGSGAFLFAALRVLVPVYEAYFTRMEEIKAQGNGQTQGSYHPSRQSLTPMIRAIISNNLYGVDIMEEAVEICKLRLFLTLVAAVEHIEDLEPLPDIDAHIHAGNALVGFSGWEHQDPIRQPHAILDSRLANEYGIDTNNSEELQRWRTSHKPFHWWHEFAQVGNNDGFDCIIGNPPYVEYSEQRFPYRLRQFDTLASGNLYPCMVERSRALLAKHGRLGMILPLAAFATRNMIPFIVGMPQWFAGSWISFYHFRPSMLFSGGKVASIPIAIALARIAGPEQRLSTSITKWSAERRELLFSSLRYCQITAANDPANRHYYAKFGHACENAIMEKVLRQRCVKEYLTQTPNENSMFYRSAGGLYWKVFTNFPWPYQSTSNKQCSFLPVYERDVFVALFNSSLFWWYYSVTFDTFNLKDYMLFGFRFTYPEDTSVVEALQGESTQLMENFCKHARHLKRCETGSYTIYARKAKRIIDDIDGILARHYDLSKEELEFIVHYDIKYRMGLIQNKQ